MSSLVTRVLKVHRVLKHQQLSRAISIAIGLMAGQGILLVLPFTMSIEDFAKLASMLAISQLIGTIGSFSLEITCPRLSVAWKRAVYSSLISIFLAAAAVVPTLADEFSIKYLYGIALAWIVTFTNILHSYALFSGNARLYAKIGLTKAATFLFAFVALKYFGMEIIACWLLAASSALLVISKILSNAKISSLCNPQNVTWQQILKFSTPSAVVVAIGTLPFVFDRALAQELLSTTDFARYALAVTWAAPLLYLGNIVTNSIVSSVPVVSSLGLLRWMLALAGASTAYILIITFCVYWFIPMPFFDGFADFFSLWLPIAIYFLVYATISAPTAAVVQKSFEARKLIKLAYVMGGNALAFLGLCYFMWTISGENLSNVSSSTVVLISMLIAFVGIFPKVVMVLRHVRNHGE